MSEEHRSGWRIMVESARANWVLVLAGFSFVTAVLGWAIYGVSPLQPIAEIGYQQKQQRLKAELVNKHLALGNDFLNVGQLEAAKVEFTKAQALDQYNIDAELGLLKSSVFEPILSRGYDPEVAERRLRSILETNPYDSHVLCFLGNVLSSIDPDSALACYDEAIYEDSSNALAFLGKGLILEENGAREAAMELYQHASHISPWNQTLMNNLGYQYFLREEYAKAESIYVRLLRLDSKYLLSYYMLAHTQLMMGATQTARDNLKIFWQLMSDTTITTLQQNNGGWFFHVGGSRPVYIYTMDERKAYAHYITALADQRLGYLEDAKYQLSEIKKLKNLDEFAVLTILWSDVERLEKQRPEWKTTLDQFKRNVWKNGLPSPALLH